MGKSRSARPAVVVLMGGRVAQRHASMKTGLEVHRNIDHRQYRSIPVEISADGQWLFPAAASGPTVANRPAWRSIKEACEVLCCSLGQAVDRIRKLRPRAVFIALQGDLGESGWIQGLLRVAALPFTGSDVAACSMATDKVLAKALYAQAGLVTPKGIVVHARLPARERRALLSGAIRAFGVSCVVKPVDTNSSVGVALSSTLQQAFEATDVALAKFSDRVLVEEFVEGPEITCAVYSDHHIPCGRSVVLSRLYSPSPIFTYQAKYFGSRVREEFDIGLSEDVARRIREAAQTAHTVLGCEGITRTDFRVRGNQPYVLETNVVPAMVQMAFFEKAAENLNTNVTGLLTMLVEQGFHRWQHSRTHSKRHRPIYGRGFA